MNIIFFRNQKSKTSNLGCNLNLRQYNLDLMARFLEIKSVNPKIKQKKLAEDLGYSKSTL